MLCDFFETILSLRIVFTEDKWIGKNFHLIILFLVSNLKKKIKKKYPEYSSIK